MHEEYIGSVEIQVQTPSRELEYTGMGRVMSGEELKDRHNLTAEIATRKFTCKSVIMLVPRRF